MQEDAGIILLSGTSWPLMEPPKSIPGNQAWPPFQCAHEMNARDPLKPHQVKVTPLHTTDPGALCPAPAYLGCFLTSLSPTDFLECLPTLPFSHSSSSVFSSDPADSLGAYRNVECDDKHWDDSMAPKFRIKGLKRDRPPIRALSSFSPLRTSQC